MNKKTIRYDGWYKSPIILDKYDLTFHNHYLRFTEGSKVEIGVLTPKNNFKVLGNGQFKIESNKIYFRIRKKVDGHESDWDGIIESNLKFRTLILKICQGYMILSPTNNLRGISSQRCEVVPKTWTVR